MALSTEFSVYNVTLTLAATDYAFTIPVNANRIAIRARGAHAITVAAHKAGNYYTIPSGGELKAADLAKVNELHFTTPDAGTVVEIIAWH